MADREKTRGDAPAQRHLSGLCVSSRAAASRRPLLILALLFCLSTLPLRAQELKPDEHPNHYVLLIDASGSARKQSKRAAFQKALGEVLPKKLYQEGFGQGVPPLDPARDLISLHHFGIVVGVSEPYYEHLQEFDLLTQFVHPVFVRREGVTPESLQSQVFPTQTYLLTFLTWSKQMALWASRANESGGTAQRTFLIAVHDGEFNEAEMREELGTLRRYADDANYKKAKQIVDRINAEYRFVGGDGTEDGWWQEKVSDGGSAEPIFIEAYEVVSSAQSGYESGLKKARPFDDLRIAWEWGLGGEPAGKIEGEVNSEFAELARSAGGSSGSLVVMGQKNPQTDFPALGRSLGARVVLPAPTSCQEAQHTAVLNLGLHMKDEVLGARTIKYSYHQPVKAPPTFSCTSGFYGLVAVGVLAAALLVLLVWYCLKYGVYTTHLKISMPGLVIPLRLRRRGVASARARVAPRETLQAFTLHLPSPWVQKIFYRGAKLLLQKADVYWDATGGTELSLPLGQRRVKSLWRVLPEEPTVITLCFEHGRQRGVVNLSHAAKEAQPEAPRILTSIRAP